MFDMHQIMDAPLTTEFKKWIATYVLGWELVPNIAAGHGHHYWKCPKGTHYDMLPNFFDSLHWWQVFRQAAPNVPCTLKLTHTAEVSIGQFTLKGEVGPTVCRVALLHALYQQGLLTTYSQPEPATVHIAKEVVEAIVKQKEAVQIGSQGDIDKAIKEANNRIKISQEAQGKNASKSKRVEGE